MKDENQSILKHKEMKYNKDLKKLEKYCKKHNLDIKEYNW